MASVGMDLGQWVEQGLLKFKCVRPSLAGLEAHLSSMQDLVTEYSPSVVLPPDPTAWVRGTAAS